VELQRPRHPVAGHARNDHLPGPGIYRRLKDFRRVFRIQALALLTAIIMLILTELVYVSGLLPIPGLDLAPFSFTISDLIFT